MKWKPFSSSLILLLWIVSAPISLYSIELKDNQSFAFEPIDYTKTPIYKVIKKHPENYRYLEKVTIYRVLYLSEGLKITGMMAAPNADGKFPVVLYNRGGNREFGSLLVSAATDILAPIAAEGYVVLATNYRGNSGSEGVEEFGGSDVMDVINLAKTCSEFNKADNSKVGLLGVSRGGMMNYLALKKMKDNGLNIQCAIAIGGITDLETTIKFHEEIGLVCEEIVPEFSTDRAGQIIKRSAIYWVSELPKNCPLLLLHSYDDAAVSYTQIPAFVDSLDKYSVPYQLMSFENDNHGIIQHKDVVTEKINYWLNKYLKEGKEFSESEKRIVVE